MRVVVRTEARRVRKGISLMFSGGIHAAALAWVALGPVAPAGPPKNLYDQEIRSHKIIWYSLKERLPEVSPGRKDVRRPRARVKAEQALVAGPKDLPKPPQLIYTPAPAIEAPQVLASPNVVAVARPVRKFVPPAEARREARPAASLPEAPQLAAGLQPNGVPLPPMARPEPRKFTPVAEAKKEIAPAVLPAAPELTLGMTPRAGAAPELPLAKAVRPFAAPAAPKATAAAPPAALTAPPEMAANHISEASLAIVGLLPARSTEIPLPKASQQAGFSAGPQPRPEGAETGGEASQLVVPGLFIAGGAKDDRPTLVAKLEPPTSLQNLMTAARAVKVTASNPASDPAHALRVSSAPDRRLEGRLVYSMAIQMPNVTSYSGSWIVWFADRDPVTGHTPADVQPPRPVRKVDPKYVAAAAEERVEGKVRLAAIIRKDGHVDTVEVVQGLDRRLDQSAREALAKWEFEPALLDGTAVEVDALFDIPFHLAPRITKK